MRWLVPLLATVVIAAAPGVRDVKPINYLASSDPYYPSLKTARLITPQWIGEEGVDAVVIIGVDDLREDFEKFEAYLRPILERLKQIDGRAPASIFCNTFNPDTPHFQTWLSEGVSLEVHTLTHPCPLLGKEGSFSAAENTYFGGIDLVARIPKNRPVAFRMPCCDSINSVSPRFFAEIFPRLSQKKRSLAIDSSVMCLLTPEDPALPREIVTESSGGERFRKYFPMEMRPPRKRTFERFAGFIENYPYPYIVGATCWEFPNIVPSDWEALNLHGPNQARTLEDWKAALDAVVIKQGVMTMVLHPHGWSDPAHIVELIDHAVTKYGRRVKFLNFPEALQRLETNLLTGLFLRAPDGGDNGVRLRDLNRDGLMDVVIGSPQKQITRLWEPLSRSWKDAKTPIRLTPTASSLPTFGTIHPDGTTILLGIESAWIFEAGKWRERPELLAGLDHGELGTPGHDAGVRLRDVDRDGIDELIVSNPRRSKVLRWSPEKRRWEDAGFHLPNGISIVDDMGQDNGLRFVDLNQDGFDDVLFSNEERYAIYLWDAGASPATGWSQLVKAGPRKGEAHEPPMIVREGTHRENGTWFRDGHMVVQNEDTANLEDVVDRRSFQELISPPTATASKEPDPER